MMPMRRALTAALATGLVCGTIACEDVFAPRAPVRPVANLSLATTLLGGAASAYDKCDAIHVTLTTVALVFDVVGQAPGSARFDAAQANASFGLDTTVAFHPAAETRISLPVDLSASVDTFYVYATLLSAGAVVFHGSGTAVLKRGETTPVTLSLAPHGAAISSVGVPSFTAIGDTIWGHAYALFSTGDTIRSAGLVWTSTNPLIVASPRDSMLVAVAEGQAQVRISYFSVYGPLTQTVTVLVNAVVASVTVAPRNPTVPVSAGTQAFTAVARDRRGNVLVRTPAWSSSNTAVAQIDATTGVARLLAAGTTYIKATVGTVRDSTLLTVQVAGPAAPSLLTAAGGSSQQINLSWSDNSLNESEFRVERCQGSGCTNFAQVFTTGGTTFTTGVHNYFDASAQLQASTTYGYRVRACNVDGCSGYSNTAYGSTLAAETTPPATPTGVTATPLSSNSVSVSWSHSGVNVVGFIVERSQGFSQAIFTQIGVLYGSNVLGFQDNSTVSATYYQYRISAFNAAGSSSPSFIATAITP